MQQTASYKFEELIKYLKEIIIVVIVISIIGIFIHSSTSLKAITRKIKNLEQHHGTVKDKIKETQRKYFVKKELPPRVYKKEMDHHRGSIGDIEKKKHELKLKRLKMISGRPRKDLENIKQEAEEHRKDLHRKYYVHKTIDKETFHKLKQGFDRIIEDIERKIELKESKKNRKK